VRTTRIVVDTEVGLTVDIWPTEPTSSPAAGPDASAAAGHEAPAAFLLIHGLASNAHLWWGSARRLTQLGHPAATVDQRGHGRSDKPDGGYTLDRACEDLVEVVQALRGTEPGWDGPVIIAGQSWGANVALELGYRFPESFAGVVCVDGGTIELSGRFADWETCAQALAPPRTTGRPAADIEALMRQAHPTWPEEGLAAQMANFRLREDGTVEPRLSFDHHMQLLRALWDHRPSTRYPDLKAPVLFVPADSGTPSTWTSDKRSSVDAALAAIPRAAAHWFSPADHDVHAQFPVEVADVIHAAATRGVLA
jgi:pimeloyl-ACP methyl ester carboxylesterase